jgi:hypothetical protein
MGNGNQQVTSHVTLKVTLHDVRNLPGRRGLGSIHLFVWFT